MGLKPETVAAPNPQGGGTSGTPAVATIGIMGAAVSSGNRGVLALGSSLVNLCAATSGGKVLLLLGNREDHPVTFQVSGGHLQVPVVRYRMSPRALLRHHLSWIVLAALLYRMIPLRAVRRAISRHTPWIGAIEKCSLVGDVRGGDSFSDIYGMRRFVLGFLTAWTVVLVKGAIVQFPQTYGPYKSPLARMMARFLLRNSAVVIARDRQSQKVAQDLIGRDRTVWLSPDVAFSLEVVRPATIELDPPLSGPVPRGIIGLNVNGLMYHGGYTRKNQFGLRMDYAAFLPELVKALLHQHPGELWLVPHTFAVPGNVESDPEASRLLRAALPPDLQGRVRIVSREYTQHEVKGVIGQCDFFVGSRMHACIAALSQGVPCVGVAYSMKFAGVFESVGMRDWVVDGRQVTNAEAVEKVVEAYRHRDAVRQPLSAAADQARSRLVEVFRDLVRVSTGSPDERSASGIPVPGSLD